MVTLDFVKLQIIYNCVHTVQSVTMHHSLLSQLYVNDLRQPHIYDSSHYRLFLFAKINSVMM